MWSLLLTLARIDTWGSGFPPPPQHAATPRLVRVSVRVRVRVRVRNRVRVRVRVRVLGTVALDLDAALGEQLDLARDT